MSEEEVNPWAAPTAASPVRVEPATREAVVPAGSGSRFLNYVIDYFVQFGLSFIFGLMVMVIFGEAGMAWIESTPGIIIGIPILVGYYFVFEAATGRTLGKLITGTKVVNEHGEAPSLGQIAGRSFARLIPFEALSFLGTPCRGWHDSLPKTYVIKVR